MSAGLTKIDAPEKLRDWFHGRMITAEKEADKHASENKDKWVPQGSPKPVLSRTVTAPAECFLAEDAENSEVPVQSWPRTSRRSFCLPELRAQERPPFVRQKSPHLSPE